MFLFNRKKKQPSESPTAKTSPEFAEFQRNYINPDNTGMIARDGLNTTIFQKLSADELAEAERLMLAMLASGDTRSIVGLGVIRSQKAATALRNLLSRAEKAVKIHCARALWRIERDPQLPALIGQLAGDKTINQYQRIDAIRTLIEMPSAESQKILTDILTTEPEYLLRYHSFNSILQMYGYPFLVVSTEYATKYAPLISTMLQNPQNYQQVMEGLNTLIEGRSFIQA